MAVSLQDAYRRVVTALESVNITKNLGLKKGVSGWKIRCPYHSGGRERTPSLSVNMNVKSKRFLAYHCFSCSARGSWPALARALGCDPVYNHGSSNVEEDETLAIRPFFDESDRVRLLGSSSDFTVPNGLVWPEYTPWRNIRGEIVKKAGGLLYVKKIVGKKGEFTVQQLFLPVKGRDGVIVGGVDCNIIPSTKGNYFNSVGLESQKHMMFLDVAEQMMDIASERGQARVVILNEGPRDALNIVQLGYAALCNLGAHTVWSDKKVNLLLRLNPDVVITMFDGDVAGRKCAAVAIADMDSIVPTHDCILPVDEDGRKLLDSSDLVQEQVDRVIAKACNSHALIIPTPVTLNILGEWQLEKIPLSKHGSSRR